MKKPHGSSSLSRMKVTQIRCEKEIITYQYFSFAADASVVASHRNILQLCAICHQRSLLHLSLCRTAVHNRPWLKGDCSCREKSATHYKILHTFPSLLSLTSFSNTPFAEIFETLFFLPVWSFANSHPLDT